MASLGDHQSIQVLQQSVAGVDASPLVVGRV